MDEAGLYCGLSRKQIEEVFKSADLFIDMGTHGAWLPEAQGSGIRVLIDGEPGFTQVKMKKRLLLVNSYLFMIFAILLGETLETKDAQYQQQEKNGDSYSTLFSLNYLTYMQSTTMHRLQR